MLVLLECMYYWNACIIGMYVQVLANVMVPVFNYALCGSQDTIVLD